MTTLNFSKGDFVYWLSGKSPNEAAGNICANGCPLLNFIRESLGLDCTAVYIGSATVGPATVALPSFCLGFMSGLARYQLGKHKDVVPFSDAWDEMCSEQIRCAEVLAVLDLC